MITPTRTSDVPAGYHTVTPFVIVRNAAEFIDFMKNAFDATELSRVVDANNVIGHAEVRIGDSVVMTFDARPTWPETPGFLRIYVDDCDAAYVQALKAGGTSVTKPTDVPWGDRIGRVRDPQGNLWWIMSREEELTEEEMQKRYGEKKYIDNLAYVQGTDFFAKGKGA